jgi:hypothetical protein
MSFVDHCLPYFRQWLISHLLLALLHFQPLFIEFHVEISSLPLFLFSGALTAPHPLCCSFQFLIYSVFFVGWGGQSAQGLF